VTHKKYARHPEAAQRAEGSQDTETQRILRSFAVFAAQDDGTTASREPKNE
jgi:hypothetical protein